MASILAVSLPVLTQKQTRPNRHKVHCSDPCPQHPDSSRLLRYLKEAALLSRIKAATLVNLRQGSPAGVLTVALPPGFQSSMAGDPPELIWAPPYLGVSCHLLLLSSVETRDPIHWEDMRLVYRGPDPATIPFILLVNTLSGATTPIQPSPGCSGPTRAFWLRNGRQLATADTPAMDSLHAGSLCFSLVDAASGMAIATAWHVVYMMARGTPSKRPGTDDLLLELSPGKLGLLDLTTLTLKACLLVWQPQGLHQEFARGASRFGDGIHKLAWSPDGEWVGIRGRGMSGQSDSDELMLASGDLGSRALLFGSSETEVHEFSWAPCSTGLAVAVSFIEDLTTTIYVVDMACAHDRQRDTVLPLDMTHYIFVHFFHWSPDDQYLAFALEYACEEKTRTQYYIVDLAALDRQPILLLDWHLDSGMDQTCLLEPLWELNDGFWNLLLPRASVRITFHMNVELACPRDLEVHGLKCMRSGHCNHVSPHGLILVKAVLCAPACKLSNVCLLAYQPKCWTWLPLLLAGTHMQAITWNPVDPDRCAVYACAAQIINSQGPRCWQGLEVLLADGKASQVRGKWHPDRIASTEISTHGNGKDEDACGALLDLTWSPRGTHLAVHCGCVLQLLSFADFAACQIG